MKFTEIYRYLNYKKLYKLLYTVESHSSTHCLIEDINTGSLLYVSKDFLHLDVLSTIEHNSKSKERSLKKLEYNEKKQNRSR